MLKNKENAPTVVELSAKLHEVAEAMGAVVERIRAAGINDLEITIAKVSSDWTFTDSLHTC